MEAGIADHVLGNPGHHFSTLIGASLSMGITLFNEWPRAEFPKSEASRFIPSSRDVTSPHGAVLFRLRTNRYVLRLPTCGLASPTFFAS